jgi:hypothetical protein
VALVSLAFAGSEHLGVALKTFVLLDFGNLLCMLLVLPVLWRKKLSGALLADPQSPSHTRIQPMLRSPAVSLLAVLLLCTALAWAWPGLSAPLEATSELRKTALTLCIFGALGLKLRFGSGAHPPVRWLAWAGLRGMGLLAVALGALATQAAGIGLWLWAAAATLLVLPPSSLLPSLSQTLPLTPNQRASLEHAVVRANIGYLALLAAAASAAVWLAAK